VTGAQGATVLTQSSYTLDANGDPTSITDRSGATDTYAYDASSRLSQVCYSTTTCTGATNYISWTYNGDANRLTETRPAGTTTYAYNSTGQLASKAGASGAATYKYDADGHLISEGKNTYKWDLAGDLTSAGGSKPTTYIYDGEGRRLSTKNGATVVDQVWDPTTGQLDEETDGSGSTLRAYTYGTSLVGMTAAGATFSYLTDAQGSVRAVVDSAGVAQWTYSFEPFGMRSGSWLNVTAGITGGAATTSRTANVNCTNGGWCSQLNTGAAPLALTAGAVSWTRNDPSTACSSVKGSCAAAVVGGALGGNSSGGGLVRQQPKSGRKRSRGCGLGHCSRARGSNRHWCRRRRRRRHRDRRE
jgi:YD repeat-containing protein